MTKRVSGVDGEVLLHWLTGKGYEMALLHRDRDAEVLTVDSLLADWKDEFRIEDLAFIPK